MFGFRKKQQPENQIPYEVYETVQQPAVERRRWIIRLVVVLLVVTFLIFGALALSRYLLNRGGLPGIGQQSGQGGRVEPPENLRQAPQQNTPLPVSGDQPGNNGPVSGSSNDSTVRQPE